MKVCTSVFQLAEEGNAQEILTAFAQEYFSKQTRAYLLIDGTYAIDGGENDIRAVHDESANTIKFIVGFNAVQSN